jgi:hypothetical protein
MNEEMTELPEPERDMALGWGPYRVGDTHEPSVPGLVDARQHEPAAPSDAGIGPAVDGEDDVTLLALAALANGSEVGGPSQ